jgi:hypothetical protein
LKVISLPPSPRHRAYDANSLRHLASTGAESRGLSTCRVKDPDPHDPDLLCCAPRCFNKSARIAIISLTGFT